MRIATYAKKLENILKHRPRFESESLDAVVTLTGTDNKPMIDLTIQDKVVSLSVEESRGFADWVKKVSK
jgi:hypothetical protein